MREPTVLDDLDLRIVAALQAAPRADWQRIGQAVEVSASTAARRWGRLTSAGLAWMSCHALRVPGISPLLAFIELDCAPARLYSVAAELLNDPHTITVGQVTGHGDLLVNAVFSDQASLARYVSFRLGGLDGVLATRSQVVTALHTDGSRWRIGHLDERQLGILQRGRGARSSPPETRTDPDAADMALMTELSADPRLSIVELATRTGLSPTTVQRRLTRLETERVLVYRCEVARDLSGWPVGATLWGSAPPAGAAAIAAQLSGLRGIRTCMSLTGPHNLMIVVWLRSLDELPLLEARLTARIPDLVIADRAMTLWSMKAGGHILDPRGRHIRLVPVGRWPETSATERESAFLAHLRDG